jgi:hypothetical protein
MRLFDRTPIPKVPDTISDKQMADLHRRAEQASTESMFSPRNVARRRASNDQRSKAERS